MKLYIAALAATALLVSAPGGHPDADAIEATARNYIEGWYEGDAGRMASALHPELAKRMVYEQNGTSMLNDQTKDVLVGRTGSGGGTSTPEGERRADVQILDTYGNAAVVRVDAKDWIDYLQIVEWNGEWLIINVLWELRPEAKARMGG